MKLRLPVIGTPPVVGGMKDAGLEAVVRLGRWQPLQPIWLNKAPPFFAEELCSIVGGGLRARIKSANRSISARPRPPLSVASSGSSRGSSSSTPNCNLPEAQSLNSVG